MNKAPAVHSLDAAAAQEEAAGNSGFWLDEDAAGTVEAEATLDSESPASVEPTDEQ